MKVVDCRICGDPHSVLRFAFVEFADDRKFWLLVLESWNAFTKKNIKCHFFVLFCFWPIDSNICLYRGGKRSFKPWWNNARVLPGEGLAFKNCYSSSESHFSSQGKSLIMFLRSKFNLSILLSFKFWKFTLISNYVGVKFSQKMKGKCAQGQSIAQTSTRRWVIAE